MSPRVALLLLAVVCAASLPALGALPPPPPGAPGDVFPVTCKKDKDLVVSSVNGTRWCCSFRNTAGVSILNYHLDCDESSVQPLRYDDGFLTADCRIDVLVANGEKKTFCFVNLRDAGYPIFNTTRPPRPNVTITVVQNDDNMYVNCSIKPPIFTVLRRTWAVTWTCTVTNQTPGTLTSIDLDIDEEIIETNNLNQDGTYPYNLPPGATGSFTFTTLAYDIEVDSESSTIMQGGTIVLGDS